MTAFVDTSLLVRYLIGDPPDIAAVVIPIIDGEENLLVPSSVITETAYVLGSVYKLPRETIVDHLVDLIHKGNLDTYGLDKAIVVQALLLCRPSNRVSFDDALLWAAARSSGVNVVYALDKRFPEDGVEVQGA